MSFRKNNPQDQYKKLFVGGLNINTTTESLRKYYEQFGNVTDAVVMRDPQTQRSRCFGFVTFETEEAVDAAQASRPHTIDDKQVDSKRAIPKDDPAPESRVACSKIFVGGLRREITQDQLRDYFSQYGTITDCLLVQDKATGQSRGFGFVTFDDTDAVDKVIVARPHNINESRADVKKALSKEEMANVKQKEAAQLSSNSSWAYGNSGGWQGGNGGYSQSNASWGNQGYGGYNGGYGQDSSNGWGGVPQSVSQMQGGWDIGGVNSGGMSSTGFGNYDQQAYGGGPIRSAPTSGYGQPYGRR